MTDGQKCSFASLSNKVKQSFYASNDTPIINGYKGKDFSMVRILLSILNLEVLCKHGHIIYIHNIYFFNVKQ